VTEVVLLAGGTGGAKLARGLLGELGPELVVIANTGDDVEAYGAHVSPDPDLVTFWMADRIDERGWGLKDDTFHAMDQLRELGEQPWFNLGDRDLAIGLHRAGRLAGGARLTQAIDDLRRAFGVPARVLVATDDPLRTTITVGGRERAFQEFMIRDRAQGPIEDVEYRGAAAPAPEAVAALQEADTIIIGPSNPVFSIDPILSVLQHDLHAAKAPVVAVSPLVRGAVLKGPTAECLRWAGRTVDSDGIVDHYEGLIDALVADQRAEHVPTL
jgi:LPPG:FO 2-phospho-L-lactate transferase